MSSHREPLSAYWLPFTGNREFNANPRILESADGMYYRAADGRRILDGTSGLWCTPLGHRHPRVVSAVKSAVEKLDYAPSFQLAHPQAFELADRLEAFTGGRFPRFFFTGSGSESVDTALKIALNYHRLNGQGTRTRLIGRERGYHGVGFGGISVGGIGGNRKSFGPLLPGVDHLPHTHLPERNAFSRGEPEYGAHLADDLERLVALHDAANIAAVIVEPVAGSTGVLVPPKGYLQRLREICTRHGILLIFDEVITGFGRLGTRFAFDHFGVEPDIVTTAKGLTNGTIPMGAVFVKDEIHRVFMENSAPGIELFHGYTYSGHPVACAAAIATIDAFEQDGVVENAASYASYWQEVVHSLEDLPIVVDVRNLGLVAGIELEPAPGRPGARAMTAFRTAFEKGLLIRVTGDVIALSPPLVLGREHIDELIGGLRDILRELE